MSYDLLVSFLGQSLRLAVPIMLCALGGLFTYRAGVLNISLEGMMLTGSLAGVLGAYYSGSAWIGLLWAVVAGALLALVFAFFTITLGAEQAVVGTAINLVALGLTGSLFRVVFAGFTSQPDIHSFAPVAIPFLSKIPLLGPVLFNNIPLIYLAFILVPVIHLFMYRTTAGLNLRSCGENPWAADSVGINVPRVRYWAIVMSGILSAIGGVVLSLGFLSFFIENMSSGKGFIALAAVAFGRWTPWGVFLAALVFGGADAFQLRLQVAKLGVPYEFLQMLPYVVTILILASVRGRGNAPQAVGSKFEREGL